jgi:hypothetical protein
MMHCTAVVAVQVKREIFKILFKKFTFVPMLLLQVKVSDCAVF